MTPERWQQLKEIFQSALERNPAERSAFLNQACGEDPALRSQVESLIASHDQAGDSIEAMAAEAATEMLGDEQPAPILGKHIGHYEVLSLLGRGGMGEVFLAQDSSLGRKVALKLLRSDFTGIEERLRRFQQEARAASALNHPNILTIHEIGHDGSFHFMATEYVEGETLRQHLSRARNTVG
ncbi:MAG: protein kinase, partial [Acidobacteriota bacterium]|nr:protein kinase [Acidobacteriota bacterium]